MYSCCCVDSSDCEPTQSWVEERTARTEHQCNECPATIEPGEKYEHVRWIDLELRAGRTKWFTHRTCWFCLKVRNDFFDCGWFYGMLREDFEECNGWDYAMPNSQFEEEDWDD